MLFRTIFSNHSKINLLILLLGLTIYILVELFERMDTFVEVGTTFSIVIQYFILRIPGIISTILPAVYFLATIILLCTMAKNRELVALQAGGVSPYLLLRYLVVISCFWAVLQLLLSQFIGVAAMQKSEELWDVEIKKYELAELPINNVWFTDDNWMVNVETLYRSGKGSSLSAYHLSEDGQDVLEIFTATSVEVKNGSWILENGMKNNPNNFEVSNFSTYTLPFNRDHTLLFLTATSVKPQNLPIQHLQQAIDELVDAGSNVEALQTAFHVKIAYAASVIALTFVAFALLTWQSNVYISVACGMLIAFLFYVSTMIGETLGETGSVAPLVAAWSPHFILVFFSSIQLLKAKNA